MSRNIELESAIKYTISNPTRYNGFLRVAANNFRLSTANQLFIYYQKEDADIVLDAGRWEKLFGRIVADNAQKIRIVQTGKTGKPQWTTYYDIADTIVTDDSKPVMRATVAQDVSMEQIREIAEKKMLLASSQIEDYMAANGIIAPAERIIGFIKDSIISEVAIKCGQEPLLYYEQINDFRKWALKDERIFKVFSAFFHNISNEMVNELSATQQRENDIETERTGGNGSDNTRGIEGEGSSAGTDGERRRGIAGINHRTEIISGKVREAEAGILGESEPSTNNDLGRVPVGADSISESSSAASVTNEAADDETAHHEKEDNGGIETSESDVVGSENDNGAERSGGSNSPRSDLHRVEQTVELADYSDEEKDELLDQVLCVSENLKYKIYFTYERQLYDERMSAADFAKFIASAYGTGGAYPFINYKGQDINLTYDLAKGLQIRAGFNDKGLSYTWRAVGRRIRHLIEDNRYLTEDEKTGYLEYIHNEEIRTRRAAIGKDLLSLVRKYNEETENKETWVNTYELTFVLNAYEGREISFGSKSVRKSLDSVLDTITTFGGEKYLPAVDGIKNRLIIEDNETGTFTFNGSKVNTDNIDLESVCTDLHNLNNYFSGFDMFIGNYEQLKVIYFQLLNYMFLSPFIARLRYQASLTNFSLTLFPFYAILNGPKSAGKSAFLNTVQSIMFGKKLGGISPDVFTRTKMYSLLRESAGVPLHIEDITKNRFRDYCGEIVKHDSDLISEKILNHPTVIMTSNDIQTIKPEYSKRIYYSIVDAQLTNVVAASQHKKMVECRNKIGTSFYREYLKRIYPKIVEMLNDMENYVFDESSSIWEQDIFNLSSKVIISIYEDCKIQIPPYVTEVSYADYFGHNSLTQSVKEKIIFEWAHNRKAFKVLRKQNRLEYVAGEKAYEAVNICQALPEELIPKQSGAKVVLKLDSAEKFFGIHFKNRLF